MPLTDRAVEVTLRFYSGDHRRRDVDNLIKLVLDACNGIAWKDDAQVVHVRASVERGCDTPRTELEILDVEESAGR